MSDWFQDARYAVRMLAKRPGASALAVTALALGIGLTTTMFSIVEGVVLRGLPFSESDRIVAVLRSRVQDSRSRESATVHDFLDWRARQTSLESMAAYVDVPVVIGDETRLPESLRGLRITPNLMTVLRVPPIAGRDLSDADAAPGAPAVALISFRQWHARYNGSARAIGEVVRLNGEPTTIVGVMPEKFGFQGAEDVWMPLAIDQPPRRGDGAVLNVIGRLRNKATVEQAAAEFRAIAGHLADAYPENRNVTARVTPLASEFVPRGIRVTFYSMLGAVLGVLLIACVNVTNLQLARAEERAGEYAIRSALGSSGWRLLRQALAEGLVLSGCGAAIGLALSAIGVAYVVTIMRETQPPMWIDIRLNAMVLAFSTAMTVAAALVSSLAPGLRMVRLDVNGVLKRGASAGTGAPTGPIGRWLVVLQVAVSCVLLIVSGLMIRTIVMTSRIDQPFATGDVLFGQLQIGGRVHRDLPAVAGAVRELEARVASIPGVRRAAVATSAPGARASSSLTVEGLDTSTSDRPPRAARVAATPGYFDVLRVDLREGRLLADSDDAGAAPVALVDDAFVAKYLSNGRRLGRRIRFGDASQPWLTVVGIVPSLTLPTEAGQIAETVYVPFAQSPARGVVLLMQTAGDPTALARPVREAVAEQFPDTAPAGVDSLASHLWNQGWMFRLFGGLFVVFGASALVMAAAGLYGLMAATVSGRTHEIGVRLALGAERRSVLQMVIGQGLRWVGLGVGLGIVPGWWLGTLMRELLAGVSPADPAVYALTAGTLLFTGTLATIAPAWRAASVDPLAALRKH